MSQYTWIDDVVVEDDPNKEVRGYAILLHNLGTTVVQIGQHTLGPDDQMEIVAPSKDGFVRKVIRIKFLAAVALAQPLANYPQLSDGNKLLISELKKRGEDG